MHARSERQSSVELFLYSGYFWVRFVEEPRRGQSLADIFDPILGGPVGAFLIETAIPTLQCLAVPCSALQCLAVSICRAKCLHSHGLTLACLELRVERSSRNPEKVGLAICSGCLSSAMHVEEHCYATAVHSSP